MALGGRRRDQQEAWVATCDLPAPPGHPFYQKLNEHLAEAGFDDFVEKLCRRYYAEGVGRLPRVLHSDASPSSFCTA